MTDLYVLVHGAWHTGAELDAVANHLRGAGHTVHCPTILGNNPDDDRTAIGLVEAIESIVEYIVTKDLRGIRLVGHSYGGMIVSGVADRIFERITRIVYVNGFVPVDGECVLDMVPDYHAEMFNSLAENHRLMLPFDVWRDSFMNDADFDQAKFAYGRLNVQPYGTFTDTLSLTRPIAELPIGKSYINCQQDTAVPHSWPWHPRLSERLGLFRLVECPGSHELMFTNPARLAEAIEQAGRD